VRRAVELDKPKVRALVASRTLEMQEPLPPHTMAANGRERAQCYIALHRFSTHGGAVCATEKASELGQSILALRRSSGG
jgi:hypothetical protein